MWWRKKKSEFHKAIWRNNWFILRTYHKRTFSFFLPLLLTSFNISFYFCREFHYLFSVEKGKEEVSKKYSRIKKLFFFMVIRWWWWWVSQGDSTTPSFIQSLFTCSVWFLYCLHWNHPKLMLTVCNV